MNEKPVSLYWAGKPPCEDNKCSVCGKRGRYDLCLSCAADLLAATFAPPTESRQVQELAEMVCTCGATKAGEPRHSKWCDRGEV